MWHTFIPGSTLKLSIFPDQRMRQSILMRITDPSDESELLVARKDIQNRLRLTNAFLSGPTVLYSHDRPLDLSRPQSCRP